MPKYFPKAVKTLREKSFNSIRQFGEPEQQDYLRTELRKLLDDLEIIARREIVQANSSGRDLVGLGDHPVYMAIMRFRRRVNV